MSSNSSCNLSTYSWWLFPVISAGLYVVGFFLALLSSLLVRVFSTSEVSQATARIGKFFGLAISKDTRFGQALAVVNLLCNTAYLCLTLYYYSLPVRRCVERDSPDIILEILISVPLVVFFVLRIAAAESAWRHWLQPRTVVDVFTLPHAFLALIFMEDWLGLRILRFVWMTQFAQVIQLFPFDIAKSQDVIKLAKILCRFLGIWLAASGIVLLLERTGDPWNLVPSESWGDLNFFDSMYFIMVTMSTVGYGDISTETSLGKLFMIFFILLALALVTVALPSLIDITVSFHQTSQFQQVFHSSQVSHFIIVCGHVTAHSANNFLKELLHPDRHDRLTHVLFLHPEIPSDELRSVLKSYYTRVKFYKGSPLSARDLERCKLSEAKAVVILANKESPDPMEEDRANLLRTVSIKKACKNARTILQLHNPHSQDLLHFCIPDWHSPRDVILCLNELKLSILAMTCITSGFCTLISNLFFTTGTTQLQTNQRSKQHWENLYTAGACYEMYSAQLSHFFHGKSVAQVASICYKELKLTLLAVVGQDSSGNVCEGAVGFFIADTAEEVQLVSTYSTDREIGRVNSGKRHFHRMHSVRKASDFGTVTALLSVRKTEEEYQLMEKEPQGSLSDRKTPTLLNQASLDGSPLKNHVVLCVFASATSSEIGLDRFVHRIRSTATPDITIVIVGNKKYMEKEWTTLQTYPEVFLVPGSPLDWSNLTQARVQSCRMCIILTAATKNTENEYGTGNKEAILCALTLKKRLQSSVPFIIDLSVEDHIHLLHSHPASKQQAYLSEPFACGHAFLSSVFDSMTTVAFHSPLTIRLLEELLGIREQSTTCGKLAQLSLDDLYSSQQLVEGSTFESLYDLLTRSGVICVGLYRKLTADVLDPQRYVITAPPPDMEVFPSDNVLALTCSHRNNPMANPEESYPELAMSTKMEESEALPCHTAIHLESVSPNSNYSAEQA